MNLFEVTFSYLDPTNAVVTLQAESVEDATDKVLERLKELPELKILTVEQITNEALAAQGKIVLN